MKYFRLLLGILLITIGCSGSYIKEHTLTKVRTIHLPKVEGRIDHLSIDLKSNRLFIAALGNNTVEVVDLNTGEVIKSIEDLDEPQGVLYYPGKNLLFVSSGGDGTCKIFDSKSFQLLKTIRLGYDADNIRLDNKSNIIFIGFGSGGIAAIDPVGLRLLYTVDLPGHPESFQIDDRSSRIFVNVPDAGQLDVIDLDKKKVTGNIDLNVKSNFPMALDTDHQVVFIGSRNPSRLLEFNANTLALLSENRLSGDADDIYYYGKDSLVFISCGSGNIDVFKENTSNEITPVEIIETSRGARTSLLVPELKKFFLAQRRIGKVDAQIIEYNIR